MSKTPAVLEGISDEPHDIRATVLGASALIESQYEGSDSEIDAALSAALRLLAKAANELEQLSDALCSGGMAEHRDDDVTQAITVESPVTPASIKTAQWLMNDTVIAISQIIGLQANCGTSEDCERRRRLDHDDGARARPGLPAPAPGAAQPRVSGPREGQGYPRWQPILVGDRAAGTVTWSGSVPRSGRWAMMPPRKRGRLGSSDAPDDRRDIEKAVERAALEVSREEYQRRRRQLAQLVAERSATGEDLLITLRWLEDLARGRAQLESAHWQE